MPEILNNISPTWYSLTMILAILLSAYYWINTARTDNQLARIYICALACAFVGAKLAYLFSEGWLFTGEDKWLHWLSGKSITGALLGGFLGVEVFKKIFAYQKITGDRFAMVVPLSIILGRLGCLTQGCCLGITCQLPGGLERWPAVPMEIFFNISSIGLFLWLRKQKLQTYQHFHIYLMAYGGFRFSHEFLRATQKPFLGLSGYQIISLVILAVGLTAYLKRRNYLTQ